MARVLGVGNALLDLNLSVDKEYLIKHNLPSNAAVIVKDNEHEQVFKDLLSTDQTQSTTGGCCANTLKFISSISRAHGIEIECTFLGRVGLDAFGDAYRTRLQMEIDNTHFLYSALRSGKVAALAHGSERCLVADLGAVNEPITEFPAGELFQPLAKFDAFYAPGAFVASSGTKIIEQFRQHRGIESIIATNLSGTFVMQDKTSLDALINVIKMSDIIFGNDEEWALFSDICTKQNLDVGLADKLKIMTCGGKATRFSAMGLKTETMPVKPISEGQVVDTTGAGDAFVAGFLAKYVSERRKSLVSSVSSTMSSQNADECELDLDSIRDAIEFGHEIAWNCVQNVGATVRL